MTIMNIDNCYQVCYDDCKAAQPVTEQPKLLSNETKSYEADPCWLECDSQNGARNLTCESELSWVLAACVFLLFRAIIIGLKICSVKLLSIPAMCKPKKLLAVNFLKHKEIKDYGACLLAASIFDIVTLAGNFVFLVFWLPGPALAFLIPFFAFVDVYVIIGESLTSAVMYSRGLKWSSPFAICACCGCNDWPVDEESRIQVGDERLKEVSA